jgi:hypothetical protein
MGSMVYFAQYLNAGGLLEGLVADCPLEYKSGNAPGKRSVIGTMLLAILNGQMARSIAEQLSSEAIWAIILSMAFRVWLRGKRLHPVVEGNQTLLLLGT